MGDWDIDKPLGQCCEKGEQIQPGQEYYAALVETGDGLKRRDFCIECWQGQKPDVYCYWKSKLAHPDQKKHIFIDDEMLMAFFERLACETDPERINFRFVLTLVLMRKRRLKYDSTEHRHGSKIWHLRVTGTKDTVEVVNPHLDEEQIEQLSSQMGEILQTDLNSE